MAATILKVDNNKLNETTLIHSIIICGLQIVFHGLKSDREYRWHQINGFRNNNIKLNTRFPGLDDSIKNIYYIFPGKSRFIAILGRSGN